jgi:uncharacterized repeat protein (TIGR03803 family)
MRKLTVAALLIGIVAAAATAQSQTVTILHSFTGNPDGNSPSGALMQATDGYFYGATTFGGVDNDGTLYRVNSTGSTYNTVYQFLNGTDTEQPANQLLQGSDGNIYGVTGFTAFRFAPGSSVTLDTLGEPSGNPSSVIQASDGNYYFSTTFGSGIFKINGSTGEITQIGTAPGFNLYGVVQASDGNLYGGELGGGTAGDSTIFKCTLAGVVTVAYTFPSTLNANGNLVEGANGQLYGVAADNSEATTGQIYELNVSNGTYTKLATIPNSDDIQAPGTLMLASDGNFYTVAQGSTDTSELLRMTPAGVLTLLYTISEPGGLISPLIQGSDGAFYGAGSTGGTDSEGAAYKLVLNPALPAPVTMTLGTGTISQGGSTTLTWSVAGAYGGSGGYCFASSADPEWTGVQATSGEVTLTPVNAGTFTYSLTCGGSKQGSATLTVKPVPKVTTTLLATAAAGTEYSATLQAMGGTPPYTWSVSSGSLPAGLTLASSTGVISGKPTTAVAADTFTAKVTDSESESSTASLSLTVYGTTIVRITTTSLPNGIVGGAYSATMAATSGTKPYTWSVYSGALPAGLAINASTGVIAGTPTTAGTSTFFIGVKGAGANTATAQLSITVIPELVVDTTLLPTGSVGISYSYTLTAMGGTSPYTWSVSAGTLPAGLTLNTSTGVISGKPTTAVTADAFTVEVTDSASHTATANLTLTVYGSTIVRITTTSLPNGTVGTAYSATLAATSGTKPYTWSVYSGELPAGLSLAASTGVISGTPTTAGTSDFFIAVKGTGNNTATAALSITIAQ